MGEIRRKAVKIRQGKRTLFLTQFSVSDFEEEGFYRVDRLDVKGSKGKQRLLDERRAKSLAKDIIDADNEDEAFLPTSVLLAAEGRISYDEDRKELFFDRAPHAKICPLDVVDGQHRIEGLKIAAQTNPRLWNFQICAVIADGLSEAEMMLQFATVNIKQEPVNKGVQQHIIAVFHKQLEVEKLPWLPRWLRKVVRKGDDATALDIVKLLESDEKSPWRRRIRLADNQKKDPRLTIKQESFVSSIKRHLLARNHPYSQYLSSGNRDRILINFWQAVEDLFIDKSKPGNASAGTVVFKTNGLEFFHSISGPIINVLHKNRSYTVEAIKACILSVREVSDDVEGVMYPEYWQSGEEGHAGKINQGGIAKLVTGFLDALKETQKTSEEDSQVE